MKGLTGGSYQESIVKEWRPHIMENGIQCGVEVRESLPGGKWTSWTWTPNVYREKDGTVYMENGADTRTYVSFGR